MADLSLSNVLQRRKKIKIITILCGVVLVGAVTAFLVSKNPKETKALTLNASTLTVNNGDVLYIGKHGLQSERPWRDTLPTNDTIQSRSSASGTGYGTAYRLTKPPGYPSATGDVYGPDHMVNMNYPTAPCPTTTWADNTTTTYTGDCKAILTDGAGAIIEVSDTININGVVFLGDRVVLKAKTINIGPNGKIIGSGQNAGDRTVWDQDNPLLGGIGGRNGGQAKKESEGRIYENPPGIFLYDPNDYNYYYPLVDTGTAVSQTFFLSRSGLPINGGTGGNGGRHDRYNEFGIPAINGIAVGGGGGSGGSNGTTNSNGQGAGGGGGGGYGLCLYGQIVSLSPGSNLIFKGGNGSEGGSTGGGGGGGGGGVIVVRAAEFSDYATINISGGSGGSATQGDAGEAGEAGVYEFIDLSPQPITIKKTLDSIYRVGAGDNNDGDTDLNDNFNPYALQVGDKIKVGLAVSGYLPGLLTIEDERLTVKYSNPAVYCEYISGSDIGESNTNFNAINPGTLEITYNVPADKTGDLNFSYHCEVKSP